MGPATDAYSVRSTRSGTPGSHRAHCLCSWRACLAPSSESMLGPTTLAVENRGSSTVKVRTSLSTATARSYPVTSQAPRTGTQEAGALARSRASTGCGSASRSASVTVSAWLM